MDDVLQFRRAFEELTGNAPFPWQEALYVNWFSQGQVPASCDLPTGLGKTSVVAVWLIALGKWPDKIPRRLVYVVNRRTVVDQTTSEVERLRNRLCESPDLLAKLSALTAIRTDMPLALSTLRGQFGDNREWCADPARPAVIVGTVDMIGSGLLFSRYTCGFKARPHHAALLGQDALLIHDEAHLEPAFHTLLDYIVAEQRHCGDSRPLRVLQLSATTRNGASSKDSAQALRLSKADEDNPIVSKRLHATKQLRLTAIADEKQLADKLSELAVARRESGRAVLVFARTVEVVQRVESAINKADRKVVVLTGTMRGKERDELVNNSTFLRFLPPSSRPDPPQELTEGTVYLIATSAGEVGVNLSADELICDLSTFESMAQRFGRVNRFGEIANSTIDVVHPESFEADGGMENARERTLTLLRELKGNASPHSLSALDSIARSEAFSPPPKIRTATDILFDAWAMTTIHEPLPGRPPVQPYLHGESKWEPPETYVAWREEVDVIKGSLLECYKPADLLDDYPLKPHEMLRDSTDRKGSGVFAQLEKLSAEHPDTPLWILDAREQVLPTTFKEMISCGSEPLYDATVILPPSVGGLNSTGTLNGKAKPDKAIQYDVADEWFVDKEQIKKRRIRVWEDDPAFEQKTEGMRLVRAPLDTDPRIEESENDEISTRHLWYWFTRPHLADEDFSKTSTAPVKWQKHTDHVVGHARRIGKALKLSDAVQEALVLAAKYHDLGKMRVVWQRSIGNPSPTDWHAKSGKDPTTKKLWIPRDICPDYRHEFGSLLDAGKEQAFQDLSEEQQDLVLHLIAAHHGRARPHFPIDESFDPSADYAEMPRLAAEVPRRFARLQRHYGRWGLAYLESLLRAADYAASAGIKPLSEPIS